jgi:hypothetical protein
MHVMRPDNSLHAWSTLISKEKMLESRTENMQSRLRYIQWGDANQLVNFLRVLTLHTTNLFQYCEDFEDKPSAIPAHAEPVVAKRVEARHNSSNLLLELLFKSNSKTIPGAAVSKYSSDQKGDISNWWLWVERFERERREEKVVAYQRPPSKTHLLTMIRFYWTVLLSTTLRSILTERDSSTPGTPSLLPNRIRVHELSRLS